jgi:hypothetical protein
MEMKAEAGAKASDGRKIVNLKHNFSASLLPKRLSSHDKELAGEELGVGRKNQGKRESNRAPVRAEKFLFTLRFKQKNQHRK